MTGHAAAADEFRSSGLMWVYHALAGWPIKARLRHGNDAALYVVVNDPDDATVYTAPREKLRAAFMKKAPEQYSVIVERLGEPAPAEEIHVIVSDGERVFAFFYEAKEMLS